MQPEGQSGDDSILRIVFALVETSQPCLGHFLGNKEQAREQVASLSTVLWRNCCLGIGEPHICSLSLQVISGEL